jgi:hypothetical protein
MNYYELIPRDNLVKNSYVADVCDLKGLERGDFEKAKQIENVPSAIMFRASDDENDGDLDDFVLNNEMVPLVTERLKRLIESQRTPPIQWVGADVFGPRGGKDTCFILNFLEHIPGIDVLRSKWVDMYPVDYREEQLRGKVRACMNPALFEEKVKAWDLFVCEEFPGAMTEMFASEQFKQEFTRQKMTGVSFSKIKLS